MVLVYETSSEFFDVVLCITHRKSEELVLVVFEKYLGRCMVKMAGVVTKMVGVFTANLYKYVEDPFPDLGKLENQTYSWAPSRTRSQQRTSRLSSMKTL